MNQASALTEDEAVAVVRTQWPDLMDLIGKCTGGMCQVLEARGLDPDDAYGMADLAYLRNLFMSRTIWFACEAALSDARSVDARAQFMAWVEEEWDAWAEEADPAEPAET
jgi:hypothetical protein